MKKQIIFLYLCMLCILASYTNPIFCGPKKKNIKKKLLRKRKGNQYSICSRRKEKCKKCCNCALYTFGAPIFYILFKLCKIGESVPNPY
ncbi:hypothetical protein ACFLYU_00145 [Candidatus Dependentiae bacterium]